MCFRAFIRRFHEAKESGASSVTVWGTGAPRREFLHVDDLAQACLMLLDNYDSHETINVGWGNDLPIKELAETVADVSASMVTLSGTPPSLTVCPANSWTHLALTHSDGNPPSVCAMV